jgi:Tol biopolymer transport system component
MDNVAQLNTSLVGRYEIERELGSGGMATVYLARDIRHQRKVALKLLKPELGAVLGGDRFLSEIQVTANLQHPNLLPLFDSGEANGLLFYVMPYVEGESLRARLDRERHLPVDEAIRIAVAVASALDYAHRRGVIHRDLKPDNILLQDGQPVVADFGIALAVSNAGGARITQTGLSLGTPQYMSPEQATGDKQVDARTDVYSLGAVLYEMLGGDPPHTGSTVQAVIAKVLTERPQSVRVLRDSVPEHVDLAIQKALAKLAADRWASAREFAEALSSPRFMTAAARSDAAPRRRLATALPWVVGGMAAVAAFIGGMFYHARHEQDHIPVRFVVNFADTERVVQASGPNFAISPDGRVLAYLGGVGREQIMIRRLTEVRSRPLAGTSGARQMAFSPDGKWLAFFSDGKLKRVAVDAGGAVNVTAIEYVDGIAWLSGDELLIATGGGLSTVSLTGGGVHPMIAADSAAGEVAMFGPRLLSDGRTVVYASAVKTGAAGTRIGVLSLRSKHRTILDLIGTGPLGLVEGHLIYMNAGGSILAVPFDPAGARVTGPPVTVIDKAVVGPNGAPKAAMSVGGSLVYQAGAREWQLMTVSSAGRATALTRNAGAFNWPRFSPDGKRIAVTIGPGQSTDLWVMDRASSTMMRVTSDGKLNQYPEWSVDGKRILYGTVRTGHSSVWWQPIDGSAPAEQLIGVPNGDVVDAVFSADGRYLVYVLQRGPSYGIFYKDVRGDTTSKPVVPPENVRSGAPRLSPDGKWMAYHSDESGNFEVYVRPFPGPGGRYIVSADGGVEPVWAPDGRRLYYSHAQQLVAAELSTSPAFAVRSRAPVFELGYFMRGPHAAYDVAPRGDELLVLKTTGAEIATIYVHDWRYELRDRLASASRQ